MGQREVLTVHAFFRPVMLYLSYHGSLACTLRLSNVFPETPKNALKQAKECYLKTLFTSSN